MALYSWFDRKNIIDTKNKRNNGTTNETKDDTNVLLQQKLTQATNNSTSMWPTASVSEQQIKVPNNKDKVQLKSSFSSKGQFKNKQLST